MMLMDKLGFSLEDISTKRGGKFSLKTVIMVGVQLLDRIKYIHQRGFLHRDIKPDNLLMGLGDKSKIMYIIDMGLSKKFYVKESNCVIMLKDIFRIKKGSNSQEQQDMHQFPHIKELNKAEGTILKPLDMS